MNVKVSPISIVPPPVLSPVMSKENPVTTTSLPSFLVNVSVSPTTVPPVTKVSRALKPVIVISDSKPPLILNVISPDPALNVPPVMNGNSTAGADTPVDVPLKAQSLS